MILVIWINYGVVVVIEKWVFGYWLVDFIGQVVWMLLVVVDLKMLVFDQCGDCSSDQLILVLVVEMVCVDLFGLFVGYYMLWVVIDW